MSECRNTICMESTERNDNILFETENADRKKRRKLLEQLLFDRDLTL